MALQRPRILLKAKNVLTGAKEYAENKRAGISAAGQAAATLFSRFKLPIIIGLAMIIFFVIFLTVIYAYPRIMVESFFGNGGNSGGVLNLDAAALEEYYNLSTASYESNTIPANDLAKTEYGSVEGFNKHIKDSVNNAGFGTRAGVAVAGVALIGDYIKATGKRLRYDQHRLGGRQEPGVEGIVNQNFYLDCSGFAWWALYNGGFKVPCGAETGTQYSWALSRGYIAPIEGGQPGDFLITHGKGHIVLIVGTYEGGYYCAEFLNWGVGSLISKYSYGCGYLRIDMEKYYNDPANKR